ncbi:MarR family transcriptional regulator [Kribbella sp. NPDC023972]|uniref:MarR family winged helix-turn-helix transcriptional regulator n=1 Tax=Kribbella sp. NPDC023972 TaxID=3154795 RepID=UPI0033DE1975
MYMSDDNKPIGWWLKELDRLLEASFERLLAAEGLTRRQWQALNAAAGPEPIAVALAPFLSGDPAELAAVTDPLAEHGWLSGDELTQAGQVALRTLMTKVQAQREQMMTGVTDDEYVATIAVLRKMAGNLRDSAV